MPRKKNYTIKDQFDRQWRYTPSCWIWIGAMRKKVGYGCIKIKNVLHAAHRIGYELYVGPIPEGKILRHICDNPKCVNPAHMLPGTYSENTQDMIERGRGVDNSGEHHGLSKLTWEDVQKIREDTRTHDKVAEEYGICAENVSMIKRNRRWKDDDFDAIDGILRGELSPKARLTSSDVIAIRNDTRQNVEIAKDFGISSAYVSNLKARVGLHPFYEEF